MFFNCSFLVWVSQEEDPETKDLGASDLLCWWRKHQLEREGQLIADIRLTTSVGSCYWITMEELWRPVSNICLLAFYWKQKSVPDFKGQADMLIRDKCSWWFEFEASAHFLISENPRARKNYAKSTLPALYNWNKKAWMFSMSIYDVLYWIF